MFTLNNVYYSYEYHYNVNKKNIRNAVYVDIDIEIYAWFNHNKGIQYSIIR